MRLVNLLESPDIAWSGDASTDATAPALGQYARVLAAEHEVVLARDPLGCHKLFFGIGADGALVVASRISRALAAGVHLDDLASCPPGRSVRVSAHGVETLPGHDLATAAPDVNFDVDRFRTGVAAALDRAFSELARKHPGVPVAVCLSGGLDSAAVASFAARHCHDVTAVSFSYVSDRDASAWAHGADAVSLPSVSSDFLAASRMATALGLRFLPCLRTAGAVATSAATAVALCQDWRDFNVHCATVNLFLAQDIRAAFPHGPIVVLTGDLMNELVCDYHEEVVDGTVYYRQPRMSIERRRRFFVRGLDAGDREIGVFGAFGLTVVQIYAAVADRYMTVPGAVLERPDAKPHLNAHLLDARVAPLVGAAKVRAQVGGADGGTLGIYHRIGLADAELRRMWHAALPPESAGDDPFDIIQVGRYRTAPRRP